MDRNCNFELAVREASRRRYAPTVFEPGAHFEDELVGVGFLRREEPGPADEPLALFDMPSQNFACEDQAVNGGPRMRNVLARLLAILLAVAAPAAVHAADMIVDPSEQFYVIGPIVKGDFDRFKLALRSAPESLATINLRSPGGNVTEALQIGRLIRSLYLDTAAALSPEAGPYAKHNCSSDHASVRRPGMCLCASACFLIWVGGITPFGDHVYVHRISFDKDYYGSLDPAEAHVKYEQGLRAVREYMVEMGVADKYYEQLIKTPSNMSAKLRWLEVAGDFTWVTRPSLNEWMIARCGGWGHPDMKKRMQIQDCWFAELAKLRKSAMQKFREAQ